MEPLSKIVGLAVNEITHGTFSSLPKLAATGLLNDFQYSWLRRFNIPYKFEMIDLARFLCNGENKTVFRVMQCNSVEDVRNTLSALWACCRAKNLFALQGKVAVGDLIYQATVKSPPEQRVYKNLRMHPFVQAG